ncbi:MAG: APC family permease [Acidobacteriaceae bacterium]|nr:APC family permease [Acidobacteriaceae bacterium]
MPSTEVETGLRRELRFRDLVLFNVAAVVSTRWIGVAAHVGPGAIVLWLLAAVFFLVPCAFVVANLSRRFPQEGGLYVWTREAFGPWHAFSCGWFYYLNNLFWIPGVLVSAVGMITYAFSPRLGPLAENPAYVLPCAFILLVGTIAANYVGLRVAKWVDNFGGIAVYLIAGILVLSALSVLARRGTVTSFHLMPRWDFDKLNFWSQLAMAMTGLELSPILSCEVHSPRKAIFRATWVSAALIVLFYLAATSSFLVITTPERISTVTGLAQVSQQASHDLRWPWVPLAVGACILLSVGGQLGTYVGACARLPFVLGIGRLLPPAFAKLHPRFGTPYISILILGFGSAVLLLISQLGETFRGAYQVMVDMTVISLFVPFLYMFGAAWRFGQKLAALSGLCVSLIAIVFSFLPTADIRSVWGFEAKLGGGCILLFILARWCYRHYQRGATGSTLGA